MFALADLIPSTPPQPQAATAVLTAPIQIFSTGLVEDKYGSEQADQAFLDKMVENFNRFKDGYESNGHLNKLEVPGFYIPGMPPGSVGIGHDEGQQTLKEIMSRGDSLASGFLDQVWRDADFLLGTFRDMPAAIGALIDAKMLSTWSAEVYRDYVDSDGNHYGPTLRRVSFLGANQPERKDLGSFPPVVYLSDQFKLKRRSFSNGNTAICFSESVPMDRNALLAALQGNGMDVSKMDETMPETALAEMVRCMEALKGANAKNAENGPGNVPTPNPPVPPKVPSPNADVTPPIPPVPPIDKKDDAPGLSSTVTPSAGVYADPAAVVDPAQKPPIKLDDPIKPSEAAKFSERLTGLESGHKRVIDTVNKLVDSVNKLAKLTNDAAEEKRSGAVATFCEEQSRLGRIPPADLAAEKATGIALVANPQAYEAWKGRILKKSPPANFSERRTGVEQRTDVPSANGQPQFSYTKEEIDSMRRKVHLPVKKSA